MSKNILFLCTGNACRSQMAEAWARNLLPEDIHSSSAGIVAHGMNPHVADVMAEVGISLEGHYSKSIDELPEINWHLVVTVCDNALEQCPTYRAEHHIHAPFPDPPKMATATNSDKAKLDCYRQVRDQIKDWLQQETIAKALN